MPQEIGRTSKGLYILDGQVARKLTFEEAPSVIAVLVAVSLTTKVDVININTILLVIRIMSPLIFGTTG